MAKPVDFVGFSETDSTSLMQWEAFEPPSFLDNLIGLLSVLQVVFLVVMYSMALVFDHLKDVPLVHGVQLFSLGFYLFELSYNCITVKSRGGRRLLHLEEILSHYFHGSLAVDLFNLFVLVVDLSAEWEAMPYIRLLIISKLPQCL